MILKLQHTQPMQNGSPSTALFLFCGNFGILLINSSWINVDGGKAALDMLEKMVEVTMMRGEYPKWYIMVPYIYVLSRKMCTHNYSPFIYPSL